MASPHVPDRTKSSPARTAPPNSGRDALKDRSGRMERPTIHQSSTKTCHPPLLVGTTSVNPTLSQITYLPTYLPFRVHFQPSRRCRRASKWTQLVLFYLLHGRCFHCSFVLIFLDGDSCCHSSYFSWSIRGGQLLWLSLSQNVVSAARTSACSRYSSALIMCSWVQDLSSVTILWLRCFDD